MPLITFPYLVNVLGMEKYGLVLFAQSFIAYFILMTDYGFNLSGTREVALNRDDNKALSLTFNSIFFARILISVTGLIILTIIVFSFEKFSEHWELYFLTYGMVAGTVLFPVWFFQGIEKMKYLSILNFIAKFIFTLLLFVIVRKPEDYYYVPALNSLGYIVSGGLSIYLIKTRTEIKIYFPHFHEILNQLKKTWPIFLSKVSTNLYTATTTFVLGLVTNNTIVGYYGVAEKVIRVIVSLFAPITQALYPYLVKLTSESQKLAKAHFQKLIIYTLILSSIILIVSVLSAKPIFELIFDGEIEKSVQIFEILSPLIVVIPLASILFNVIMLSFELDKYFLRLYVSGAFLNIFLLYIFLFVFDYSAIGAAISLLICETTITVLAVALLIKKNILNINILKAVKI